MSATVRPARPAGPSGPDGPLAPLVRTGLRRAGTGGVWSVGDAHGVRERGRAGVLGRGAHAGREMDHDTVFDLASLTKIIALWPCAGALRQSGRLPLDRPLREHWPAAAGHPAGQVTVRQLLTHTAGMPLRTRFAELYGSDPAAIRAGVLGAPLHRPPGVAVEYTDRAAVLLGHLVEDLAGAPLDELAARQTWQPLGMTDTRYGPLHGTPRAGRTAPTETAPTEAAPAGTVTAGADGGEFLCGTVHDPSARLLGGVSGNAGAFSTAHDLERFLTALLAPPATAALPWGEPWITESLRVHTGGLAPARGLSWLCAAGTDPAEGTFVHYGFTGTGVWISRRRGRWALLLTNKVHYDRDFRPLTNLRNAFRRAVFG
ncbi:serine hydrolase domain-containing protein [Kitasatospora sp. NPDC056327]|uniref:serine hydrolase domain-containing protein n=1 Tax=Kitasatospora sp. NPDC056327 TaxID=3345785 RepID=UPI0035E2E911